MTKYKTIILLMVAFALGFAAHAFNFQGKDMVKLERTRSGTFFIQNGKIYESLELPTNRLSFQNRPIGE